MKYVILDSVAFLQPSHKGQWIFTGSHGGMSAARQAAQYHPAGIVFNDAGRGKEDAGISGVAWLEQQGIAAACVDAFSAKIGSGQETFLYGIVSACNALATKQGLRLGLPCRLVVAQLQLTNSEEELCQQPE